jgi:hypothetical protein
MRAYSLLLFLAILLPAVALCQALPADVREGFQAEFQFSPEDFAKVESGRAVARMIPTGRPDDVRMAGIVLIKTSSERFIKAFNDIEQFEASPEVVQTHRFSSPPAASDLTDYHADFKKPDVLACHPGHCSYKLPVEAMTNLQKDIDWDAPDANAKADEFVRQRFAAYINNYRLNGDRALAVYYDTPQPYSLAEGLHSLIGSESQIADVIPALLRFASDYPANRPPNTEDFFYWQEAAFGLKHVLRAQHVIEQKLPVPGDPHYASVSKMLFASHYFRAAIEFMYAYPVRTPSGEPAIYLISAQRSYIDGMTGVKGAFIRKIAQGRSPAKLAENLELAKQRLEGH